METKREWVIYVNKKQMKEFDKVLKEAVEAYNPKYIQNAEDLHNNEINTLYAERLYGSISHEEFIRLTKEADEKFEESKKSQKL